MSSAALKRYTVEEYLELERDSETKHEYYDGQIFELHRSNDPRAMAGATFVHNQIALNVASELRSRFRGGPCRVLPGDMRVLCPTGLRTYPDAVIVCDTPDLEKIAGAETLKNPSLIVEVLSPSTERYDRGTKFDNYRTIPSLKGVILVAQFDPCVEYFARRDDGRWLLNSVRGLDREIELPEFGISLRLADIYSDVVFTTEFPRTDPGPPKS